MAASLTAVGWSWRHAGRSVRAIDELDLRIEPGERVLLLGPSGAGKSTLLHGIAGVLGDDPDHSETGRLLVDGAPAASRRGRVGLLQQDPESQVVLARVGDDVAFGAENLAVPRAEIWTRVAESLEAVGLDLPLDHPTSRLSGGQKQRLGLAGILAMRPGAILLDEPTANVDPDGVLEVRDAVLRTLDRTGATLVVVEHRVEVWVDAVDRIVVLTPGGGVLADGPPGRVLTDARDALISAGVWVPGFVPAVRRRAAPAGAAPRLLSAHDLGVARAPVRHRRSVVPIVTGIEVRLQAGQALAVTGPNGVGKSTLALTLAGLLPAAGGSVVAGDALRSHGAAHAPGPGAAVVGPCHADWSPADLITRVGTVFQEPEHQFVTSTVYDELAFGPRRVARAAAPRGWGRRWRARDAPAVTARIEELLARLGLDHLRGVNPFTLSGGEKRRLSVATVLATAPAVLVLDEPTFGQDATTWAELASLLVEQLDSGRAVVAVTHDAEFTAALAGACLHLGARSHRLPAGCA